MYYPVYRNVISFRACLLIATLIALPFTKTNADIRLNADFESGILEDYNLEISGKITGNKIVDTNLNNVPTCNGSKSVVSNLVFGDGTKRAEVKLVKDPFNSFAIGQRHWFSFAVFLPSDFTPDFGDSEIVWQLHGRPDAHLDEAWRNPPFAVRVSDDKWTLEYIKDSRSLSFKTGETKNYEERNYDESGSVNAGKYETGKWTTFVIDTLWDYRSQGYIKVWKDGQLVLNKTNGIGFNDVAGPYVKMGIYKARWGNLSKGPTSVSSRTVYHDEFKVGGANSTYLEMMPICNATQSSPTTPIFPPTGLMFVVQ